jgi:hypothetical protein
MTTLHSDTFGRTTGVTVRIETRPSRRARWALALASLAPVPLAPLAGALVGSAAIREIAGNPGLRGKKTAGLAYWLGLGATALQVSLAGLCVFTVHHSIEVAQRRLVGDGAAGDRGVIVEASAAFPLVGFRPGEPMPFEITSADGIREVRVMFSSTPSWGPGGPVFAVEQIRGSD